MLVARERFDYQDRPLYQDRGRQVKRVRRINPKTRFLYCGLALVALFLAFWVTSRYAHITSLGYEIIGAKKQLQELATDNQLLQNKIVQLNSLNNIEYIAIAKLGMQKPELAEGVQFVPVEYSKAGSPVKHLGIASATHSKPTQAAQDAKKTEKRSFLVQALATLING